MHPATSIPVALGFCQIAAGCSADTETVLRHLNWASEPSARQGIASQRATLGDDCIREADTTSVVETSEVSSVRPFPDLTDPSFAGGGSIAMLSLVDPQSRRRVRLESSLSALEIRSAPHHRGLSEVIVDPADYDRLSEVETPIANSPYRAECSVHDCIMTRTFDTFAIPLPSDTTAAADEGIVLAMVGVISQCDNT